MILATICDYCRRPILPNQPREYDWNYNPDTPQQFTFHKHCAEIRRAIAKRHENRKHALRIRRAWYDPQARRLGRAFVRR